VYPSQVLSISKSPSLQVELGKELSNIQSSYLPRKKSLTSLILHFVDTVERLVRKSQAGTSSSDHSKDDDAHNDKKG
jgi:hypothetical protein